jgi:hypothetical protein
MVCGGDQRLTDRLVGHQQYADVHDQLPVMLASGMIFIPALDGR